MEPITMTLLAIGGITAALAAKKAKAKRLAEQAVIPPVLPMVVPTAGREETPLFSFRPSPFQPKPNFPTPMLGYKWIFSHSTAVGRSIPTQHYKQVSISEVPQQPVIPSALPTAGNEEMPKRLVLSTVVVPEGQSPSRSPTSGYFWKKQMKAPGGWLWREQLIG